MKTLKICLITLLIFGLASGLAFGDKGGQGKGKALGLDKQSDLGIVRGNSVTAHIINPSSNDAQGCGQGLTKYTNLIAGHHSLYQSLIIGEGTGVGIEGMDLSFFDDAKNKWFFKKLDESKKFENGNWLQHPFDGRRQGECR